MENSRKISIRGYTLRTILSRRGKENVSRPSAYRVMDDHPFVPADIETALGRRYVVGPQIAIGGQGAVFKATRTSGPGGTATNDVVALKLHLYESQDIRVQREIAAMENVSHATLPRLVEHGYCDVGGRQTRYVAWEFIDGQTLSDRLKSGGRLLESEVLPIGRDVSAAIAEIWSRRIVHGDIKPSNIMLRNSGGAVLIDLGAARHLQQDNSPAARRPYGTLGYISPEQARAESGLTCASDIFSLGIVMLQSLIGRHPTDYDQAPLADGIRASGSKLAVSYSLLCALDQMLSVRPSFRPTPAEIGSRFQRLQEMLEEEYARGARAPQKGEY
jgi:serine/threonine protein kinase